MPDKPSDYRKCIIGWRKREPYLSVEQTRISPSDVRLFLSEMRAQDSWMYGYVSMN